MTYSLYDGAVLPARASVKCLRHLLTVASQQPASESLLAARLHQDMRPLTFQTHIATGMTRKLLVRLTGRPQPDFEDNLASYRDIFARIDEVEQDLSRVDQELVGARAEHVAPTQMGPGRVLEISSMQYAHAAALPTIFFHVSIIYAIMRKEGVPLGKRDLIESFVDEHVYNL